MANTNLPRVVRAIRRATARGFKEFRPDVRERLRRRRGQEPRDCLSQRARAYDSPQASAHRVADPFSVVADFNSIQHSRHRRRQRIDALARRFRALILPPRRRRRLDAFELAHDVLVHLSHRLPVRSRDALDLQPILRRKRESHVPIVGQPHDRAMKIEFAERLRQRQQRRVRRAPRVPRLRVHDRIARARRLVRLVHPSRDEQMLPSL
mmetsp:Transcript_8104/g.32384  ORF Transcript_8104/g.32384 Transcript_8104/m.32384 type:complete len:209 (-) Transcript_8104:321-947(-)